MEWDSNALNSVSSYRPDKADLKNKSLVSKWVKNISFSFSILLELITILIGEWLNLD